MRSQRRSSLQCVQPDESNDVRGGAAFGTLDAQALLGNAAVANQLPAVQLRGGGGGLDPAHRKDRAVKGVQGSGEGMPHLARLQRSFGEHDLSGMVAHVDDQAAAACADLGASGFTLGEDLAFPQRPTLELAAHEAAHYVMQRAGEGPTGPAGQAGDAYERHADEVAERVVAGESAADLLPSPAELGTPTSSPGAVQCYSQTPSGGQLSENGNILLESGQSLYADPALISSANAKLQGAGQNGSFIKLVEEGGSSTIGGKTLKAIQPSWDASKSSTLHQGAADANKTGMADSNGVTDGPMALWSDCGRSSAAVTGSRSSNDRSVIFNKDGATTKGKGVSMPGAAFDDTPANMMASQVYYDLIPGFISRPDNEAFLKEGVHFIMVDKRSSYATEGAVAGAALGAAAGAWFLGIGAVPGALVGGLLGGLGGAAIGSGIEKSSERVRQYITPKDATHAKQMYWELGEAGRDRFDQEAGINHYANPEIGESYSMATEPEMPGFKQAGDSTWNFHWAGVIMKDGGDNVTLENYAMMADASGLVNGIPQADYINRDWGFYMYGTQDKDQSFHAAHLGTGTHGTHATSIRVETDK